MSTEETIAAVSAALAAVSILANIGQAWWIHRLTETTLDRKDLIDVLATLQAELYRSNLFDMNPHDEVWEYGFETLQHVSGLIAAAQVAIGRRKNIPPRLHAALHNVATRVKLLRLYRDDYTQFRHGKGLPPYEVQRQWPKWEDSINQLISLQPAAVNLRQEIDAFIAEK